MKMVKYLVSWLGGAMVLFAAGAAVGAAVPGKDYVVINPPQATDTGNKIEVVEAFSYMCPHCNDLEPSISQWVKLLPQDVQFRRMPVVFGRQSWETLAKTYYALEAIGKLANVHPKVFEAIHDDNIILQNKDTLFDWVEKQGVDKKKFADAFNSFSVQGKVQRTNQKSMAYGVNGVPSIIVDGKYLVSTSQAQSYDSMLKTVDQLIQMIRATRATQGRAPANKAQRKPVAQR